MGGRPLCQSLRFQCLNDNGLTGRVTRVGTLGRASVPVKGYYVSLYYNGRSTERPYSRYTSRFDGTDVLSLDTSRASLHGLLEEVFEIVPAVKVGRFAE